MDLHLMPLEERIAMDAAGAMALGAFAFVPDDPAMGAADSGPAGDQEAAQAPNAAEAGAQAAVSGLREVLGIPGVEGRAAVTPEEGLERDPRFDDLAMGPVQAGTDALLDLDGRLDLLAGGEQA